MSRFTDIEEYGAILITISSYLEAVEHNGVAIKSAWEDIMKQPGNNDLMKRYFKAKLAEVIYPVVHRGKCQDDIKLMIVNYIIIKLSLLADYHTAGSYPTIDSISRIIAIIEQVCYGKKQKITELLEKIELFSTEKISALIINY